MKWEIVPSSTQASAHRQGAGCQLQSSRAGVFSDRDDVRTMAKETDKRTNQGFSMGEEWYWPALVSIAGRGIFGCCNVGALLEFRGQEPGILKVLQCVGGYNKSLLPSPSALIDKHRN